MANTSVRVSPETEGDTRGKKASKAGDRTRTRRKARLPFAGVDGEGGDIAGRHQYLLLRAGDSVYEPGSALDSRGALHFLSGLATDREYVSFFFDYDVTMMLRDLPENRLRRLMDRESRTPEHGLPIPVGVGPYEIDYLPRKEFRVRRVLPDKKRSPWVVVNDTGTFFQSAFLTALKRWGVGNEELWKMIGEGKDGRKSFGAMTEETRLYNGLEIELLEDLMEQFRRLCEEVGYVPRQWQGPGNIASAMFLRHGIPKSVELEGVLPHGLLAMAQAAYYGGRFETTAVGDIKGPVYQYDINSAYPYACTLLPCLMHGVWVNKPSPDGPGVYVAEISFAASRQKSLHPFPVRRKDGSIFFPRCGSGWYWSPEVEAAFRAGTKVSYASVWQYEKRCDCSPFAFVRDVYAERVRVGKTGKGLVLKLALNSLYGKLAQSIGSAPYSNPVWAGLITSITRAMLYRAVSDRNDCFMLATDGIFLGAPAALPTGTALGEWDYKIHESGMFIIQPGLYFLGEEKPKTRGVPMGKVFERRAEFETVWSGSEWGKTSRTLWTPGGSGGTGPAYPSVSIPIRSFIGLRLAMARNKPETAGMWIEDDKEISFDWSTKRKPYSVSRDRFGLRTHPYEGPERTTPYRSDIGGNLMRNVQRLEMADLPDWADGLVPLDREEA